MIERIKTLLLTVLVSLSILLSLGIWGTTPQFEAIDGPQYASNAAIIDPTYQRTIGSVTLPRSIIFHLGGQKHTAVFPGQSGYEQVTELLQGASFVDIDLTNDYGEPEWLKLINEGPTLQVEFDAALTTTALDESELLKFTTRLEPSMQVKSLYLFPAQEDGMMRALFYGGVDNRMYLGRVMIKRDRFDKLFAEMQNGPAYGMFGQSLHKNFYLPLGRIKVSDYAISYNDEINVQRMIDSYFIDKSLTRRVIERDNSQIVTDGSRLVRVGVNDQMIEYRLLDLDKTANKDYDPDIGLMKALSFVNEHGGFTGQLMMHEVPFAEVSKAERRLFEFRQIVGGAPIIGDLSTTTVDVYGYEVAMMKRSVHTLGQKAQDRTERELLSGPEVLQLVEKSAWLDRNRVTDVYLAYLIGKPQDQSASLRPVWVVEQAQEGRSGLFDGVTGERLREEEGFLHGLE